MLLYHPMHDPYHSAFRQLCILISADLPAIEFDRIRILDFYLLFPSLVSRIRLPKECMGIRKEAKGLENDYNGVISIKQSFDQVLPFQLTSVRHLAAFGIVDPRSLEKGLVCLIDSQLPPGLTDIIQSGLDRLDPVKKFVLSEMVNWPLGGTTGLKARSQLIEHRYDVA